MAAGKRPKDAARWTVELEPTEDIARARRAEAQDKCSWRSARSTRKGLERKRAMLETKNADLVVFNDVGRGDIAFDANGNEVVLISREGERTVPKTTKAAVAVAILDAVEGLLQ